MDCDKGSNQAIDNDLFFISIECYTLLYLSNFEYFERFYYRRDRRLKCS